MATSALYASDVLDVANRVPVKKGGRKRKAPTTEPKVETAAPAVVQEKKPRTEAQIAATKKAAEARKAKKLANEEAIAEVQRKIEASDAALVKVEKRRVNKLKREAKAKRASDEMVDEAVDTVFKKPKVEKKVAAPPTDEPPAYIKTFIHQTIKAQNEANQEKKPAKQMRTEATQQAKETWDDGMKRDVIRNEQDKHFDRMYKMMFAN